MIAEFGGRDHWFRFKGSAIYIREYGTKDERADTLVFLHGRLGHGAIWKLVSQELQSQFRCLVVDFPGFGRSFAPRDQGLSLLESADLVNLILERLQPGGNSILIGHDLGGAVAQLSALQYPNRMLALVLTNSGCLGSEMLRVSTWPRGMGVRWELQRILRGAGVADRRSVHELHAAWKNPWTRAAMVRALEIMERSWPGPQEQSVWRRALRTVPHPTLLLWGSRDELNPTHVGFELMRRLPEAYFYQNESCGHWLSLEDPGWVTTKIREFAFRLHSVSRVRRSLSR